MPGVPSVSRLLQMGLADVELATELGWLHSDSEFDKLVVDVGMPALRYDTKGGALMWALRDGEAWGSMDERRTARMSGDPVAIHHGALKRA